MAEEKRAEPWLRGTLTELPAVPRAVLHALELAQEDLTKWCGHLSDTDLNARPEGIAPVAFHIRHIARSTDRLLTYAEGKPLVPEQIAVMKSELTPGATSNELFAELASALEKSAQRIRVLGQLNFDEARTVGPRQLPTSLGGLLVHVADHAQRHVGQAVTTSKIVAAQHPEG